MLRDCVCICNEVQFRLFAQGGHTARNKSPLANEHIYYATVIQ